jgi:tetratricopeptide (TPR) repeat protein
MRRAAALAAAAIVLAACASSSPPSDSASAYADFLIGRIASGRADHPAAADRYFAALARSPRDAALLEGALTASLASGDEARARQAARMAPASGAPAYAHLVRAADALVAHRWRQADAELGRVEGRAAEELMGRTLVVWTRAAEGRIDDVLVDLAPLAAIRPYGALFGYQQAMALDYAGRDEQALAAYESAASGGLWSPAAIEHHADLLVRMGARDRAIALLSTDENRANPALAAALARVQSGQAVASSDLTPARGAAAALYGLSVIFLQEYDRTNGLAALTLSLMLDPAFDGARLALAQQQSSLGHIESARAALARIPPESPYAGSSRAMEAWILLDAGDEDGALTLARANAENGDAHAKRTLADMYRNLERYAEAEPIYSELIQVQPGDWRLYFARGAARERLSRWPEAEADLRRALELSPDQPAVLNYLGYSWVDRGERLQEGLALIERAVELRPRSGVILDSLGWAHYRLGDYARAVELLEQAVEFEPAHPTLNDHLGDAYWRLGRRIEARFQWERALTLEPDAPDTIREKLQNGLPLEPAARSAER